MSKARSRSLDEIADDIRSINAEHADVHRKNLEYAKRLGELMVEARSQCPSGTFHKWVKEHFGYSKWWVQAVMRVAQNWEKVQKYPGHLQLDQAICVAYDRPVPKHSAGAFRNSVGRLLDALESKVGDLCLHHPELSDITDAIHSWRERIANVGALKKDPFGGKTGMKVPANIVKKVRAAHEAGYQPQQIYHQLRANGVEVSHSWVVQVCSGKTRAAG